MTIRRAAAALACVSLLLLALSCSAIDSRRSTLPDRIDDATFWRLFTELSEPGGTFRSDNLVSNERAFPAVLPEVARRASPGAAYIGVGPEQNFSYLAALRPRVAFIVDIRRENAALHLLYKAIFELSPTRAEFLSRLFSRPLSKHLGPGSTANELMEAAAIGIPSRDLFTTNLADVRAQLATRHRWPISDSDLAGMTRIYEAFLDRGPDIRYSMRSARRGRPFPTYAELMTAADAQGVAGSFLASEERLPGRSRSAGAQPRRAGRRRLLGHPGTGGRRDVSARPRPHRGGVLRVECRDVPVQGRRLEDVLPEPVVAAD